MNPSIIQNAEIIVSTNDFESPNSFQSVQYPIFVLENHWFHIFCKPNDDSVDIYFYINCPIPVTVNHVVTVNSVTKRSTHTYEKHEGFVFEKFGKKTDLFQDNVMKVQLSFSIDYKPELLEHVDKKTSHIVGLMFDDKFKDFKFCVGNQEVKVHKSFIGAASPVFAAMLEPHTKESQEGQVTIIDFDYPTIREAVDWIYVRHLNCNSSVKNLLNLSKFADKYDLVDKEMIFEVLYKKIKMTTILEISKFSAANGLDQLYNKCIDFFVKDFDFLAKTMKKFKDLDPEFVMDVVVKKYRSVPYSCAFYPCSCFCPSNQKV